MNTKWERTLDQSQEAWFLLLTVTAQLGDWNKQKKVSNITAEEESVKNVLRLNGELYKIKFFQIMTTVDFRCVVHYSKCFVPFHHSHKKVFSVYQSHTTGGSDDPLWATPATVGRRNLRQSKALVLLLLCEASLVFLKGARTI